MKKIILLGICSLMLGACRPGKVREEAMQQQRDSLQRIINDKDLELNDIMATFNEVQEGIRRINEAEGRVTIADATRENVSSREVIKENMQFIQEAMQQNKDMIAQLKEKLKKTSFNADKLSKTIENLQSQIDRQNAHIQELEASLAEKDVQLVSQGEQIDQLSNNVNNLTVENKVKTQQVLSQDKELHQAWFVFGTKDELKEQKILQNGTVLKSDNFNKDYFTQIDTRYDKDIKLYSKSAEILSTHPSGSYKLTKDAQGQYELHITNPTKFWSVSKYLVVKVK